LTWLWGYLIPMGLLLVFWSALPAEKGRRVTPLAILALALASVAYWLVGFAFHLGGAGVIMPDPALSGLDRIWSPLDQVRGLGWGMIGLAGFALSGTEVTPKALELFLTYLPLLSAAVLLVALALSTQRRWVLLLMAGWLALVVWPLAACWLWGGGWLAQLGLTQALGHGVVDFGGSALLFWLPGVYVAAFLALAPRRPVQPDPALPPAPMPMLATLGAFLAALGLLGWALGAPFHTYGATLDVARTALSLLLGMAGAIFTASLYGWLASGELDALLTARGMLAGLIAALAGAPFLAPWAVFTLGLLTGLLVPFVLYLVEVRWRWQDEAALVALALSAALPGVLWPGLLADGRYGQGWNGVTAGAVRGWLPGGGAAQLIAQLAGLLVLGAWGGLWGAALGGLARLAQRPQQPSAQAPVEPEDSAPETSSANVASEEVA